MARAPAVAAVTRRRVRLDAPTAVNVRTSPAVSARIKPMVIAKMARATAIPAAVAADRRVANPA